MAAVTGKKISNQGCSGACHNCKNKKNNIKIQPVKVQVK